MSSSLSLKYKDKDEPQEELLELASAAGYTSKLIPIMSAVTLSKAGKIATVTINDSKVNIMTLAVWNALLDTLHQAEADPSISALIYRSGLKKNVFTAGNDITELYAPNTNKERYATFWLAQNKFLSHLARSRLFTVAAVRGACPAGGCALALCCDERYVSSDASSGLNEARIGISVPGYWQRMMAHAVGEKQAERLCSLGMMLSATDLEKVGFADGVFEASALEAAVQKRVEQVMKEVPDAGRVISKTQARRHITDEWADEARINQEAADKWPFLASEPVVKALGATLQRLAGNKKAKM
jgi:3,2-trans-enoyl-CoA isomerase